MRFAFHSYLARSPPDRGTNEEEPAARDGIVEPQPLAVALVVQSKSLAGQAVVHHLDWNVLPLAQTMALQRWVEILRFRVEQLVFGRRPRATAVVAVVRTYSHSLASARPLATTKRAS